MQTTPFFWTARLTVLGIVDGLAGNDVADAGWPRTSHPYLASGNDGRPS